MEKWLNTEEAAEYVGIGKTQLYQLSQTGKIPASKAGRKWLYEKEKLDGWLRGNKIVENFFMETPANIESNDQLREPQREAYLAAYDYFRKQNGKKAILQLPVGCGKTGVASILPFGISEGRVLVIAPNITIKKELKDAMDITNRQKCFWRKRHILEEKDMVAGPYVYSLEEGNISIAEKSHIVISNIQQLATNPEKWLAKFDQNFFDLIIVDEAHHEAANSWKMVFTKFPQAKVISMTATPFRSDRQEMEGDPIYRYPFKSATIKGFIKKLRVHYVAPSELTFTIRGAERTYTLKEVLRMKDEVWFSKGVALSDPCNESIVNASLEQLEKLRLTGTRHQLIAVACSINHAQKIRSLYNERGYLSEIIHSQQDATKQEEVIRDLKNGTLDCIIQVQMLGEGFDHPKLSVAAIFRPFRSLSPYIQFVGRILRVVVQNNPTHPDNYGHIVTHVGMGLDKLLQDFKLFEKDDQAFWEKVTGGEEPEPPSDVKEGKGRMKLLEEMAVTNEILDSMFEEDFSTVDDEDIIAELERQMENLGLDATAIEAIVRKQRAELNGMQKADPAQPFPKLPQQQWREAKKRLTEEVSRTANVLLNRCELGRNGVDLPFKLKPGIGGGNNYVAAVIMVNKKIGKQQGAKKRGDWSLEEYEAVMKLLPSILNDLVKEIKKIQYEQKKNSVTD